MIQGPPRLLAELPALEPEPRLRVFGLDSFFLVFSLLGLLFSLHDSVFLVFRTFLFSLS